MTHERWVLRFFHFRFAAFALLHLGRRAMAMEKGLENDRKRLENGWKMLEKASNTLQIGVCLSRFPALALAFCKQ